MTTVPHPKVEQPPSVKIITFTPGKIRDVETMIARELAGQTPALGECQLLLDFRNVAAISSLELVTLISLHKAIQQSGGRLVLFNMKPEIFEVFTVSRLHTFLIICRESSAPEIIQVNAG